MSIFKKKNAAGKAALLTVPAWTGSRFRGAVAAGAATVLAVLALTAGFPGAQQVYAANRYTPVSGQSTTNPSLKKYLIMRAGDMVPQVTFHYTVTAGKARSSSTSDNSVMEVRAGVDPGSISVSDAVFSPSKTTSSSASPSQIDVQRTDRTNIRFETAKGEKFAVVESVIDFSSVSFNEPGIYRYVITESVSSADQDKGILPDEDTDRILDVYVTDDGRGNLKISSYVLHRNDSDVTINNTMGSGDVQSSGAAVSDKTDGFTSEYKSIDLVFLNKVTGNQASRDKYFIYTLKLTGLQAGDKYVVSLADDANANTTDGNADAAIAAYPNTVTTVITSAVTQPTILTVPAGGELTQCFYLQDGQSIAIQGLPQNAKYTLTENPEDYKWKEAAVNGYTDAVSTGSGKIVDLDRDGDQVVRTSYLNQRSGVIPTGIMLTTAPGILVILAGAAGLLLTVKKNRKRNTGNE